MTAVIRRVLIAGFVMLLVAVFVVLGVRALLDALHKKSVDEGCRAGDYSFTPGQTAVASAMTGVVRQRGLPERAAVLVLAAGLQESKLRNLAPGDGDRDSVGVLQQRPSQGWGTEEQLSDLHFATGAFLNALVKIDHWQTDRLTDVIQAVQISAVPYGYAQHEGQAQALADALTGKTPAGITCSYPEPTMVTAPADIARQLAQDVPVRKPAVTATTVGVPGGGWPSAAWFVANGERLGLERVSYSGQKWTRTSGWNNDPAAPAGVVVATIHQ
ncbi:MAG: hypothetical protein ABJB98_07840 [Actinomycetota bacterium]